MLAVVKDPAQRGILLEDVPVPGISPWETLVRVRAVGICGSDQRIYQDVSPGRRRRLLCGTRRPGGAALAARRLDRVYKALDDLNSLTASASSTASAAAVVVRVPPRSRVVRRSRAEVITAASI